MRYGLVLAALALLAPAHLRAADPPLTFHTQPLSKLLTDVRVAADIIGGERAVKSVDAALKDRFGAKGFDGLDLNRPAAGYLLLAPKPEDVTLVVALPVTNEKAFLGLCERFNGNAPKDLGKGLYELPPLVPNEGRALMRFENQHAYIAYAGNPEPALDPKALVGPNALVDPAEPAFLAAKFHFDRLTPEVKKAIPTYLAELKKLLEGVDDNIITNVFRPLGEELVKMLGRYALLLSGADTATLKLNLDAPTGDVTLETALVPKPDTPLATLIAARKPTANKFGSFVTPDTVAGFKTRLPFFNAELRDGTVKTIEKIQTLAAGARELKDLVDELCKGLIRTVKTGEFDIAGAVRGPDKNGDYTAVLGVAFEDPAGVEKEFRKFIEIDEDIAKQFKWDADKAGKVSIHTYKGGRADWADLAKPFGREKAQIAFAFAPHGVLVALGPDAIATVKGLIAARPVETPVLDVVLNPVALKKFADRIDEPGGPDFERLLGKENKLISAASLNVSGGKELKVQAKLNLRALPRLIANAALDDAPGEAVPDKKP